MAQNETLIEIKSNTRDIDASLDSWIAATLTLFWANPIPYSASLFPIMLAELCSLFYMGICGDGDDFGCCVAANVQELHAQYLVRRVSTALESPEHFACILPEHLVHRYPAPRQSMYPLGRDTKQ